MCFFHKRYSVTCSQIFKNSHHKITFSLHVSRFNILITFTLPALPYKVEAMEETLQLLNSILRETLRLLEGPLHSSLQSALHDDSKLPEKKISQLASPTIDLLHKTEQLLEPPSLVLAGHFLGTFLFHSDSKNL